MAVAPSFTNYKTLSEPFDDKGKMYIMVEHPNTHNSRKVRWYTEAEFSKLYGKKIVTTDRPQIKGLKQCRGFAEGPIKVLHSLDAKQELWCRNTMNCWYANGIGWYIASQNISSTIVPADIKTIELTWEEFRDGEDYYMKTPSQLTLIINDKIRTSV